MYEYNNSVTRFVEETSDRTPGQRGQNWGRGRSENAKQKQKQNSAPVKTEHCFLWVQWMACYTMDWLYGSMYSDSDGRSRVPAAYSLVGSDRMRSGRSRSDQIRTVRWAEHWAQDSNAGVQCRAARYTYFTVEWIMALAPVCVLYTVYLYSSHVPACSVHTGTWLQLQQVIGHTRMYRI